MIRDRVKKLFGQEDDPGFQFQDQYFSDVTKVDMSLSQGLDCGSTRTVAVTEGYGPSAKEIVLHDVKAIYFDPGKYDYIIVHNQGTFVGMAGSKDIPGYFDADARELRIGVKK